LERKMRRSNGFLMIEILIAFAIFSLFILFIARTQVDIIRLNAESRKRSSLLNLISAKDCKKEIALESFVLPSEKMRFISYKKNISRSIKWSDLFVRMPKKVAIQDRLGGL